MANGFKAALDKTKAKKTKKAPKKRVMKLDYAPANVRKSIDEYVKAKIEKKTAEGKMGIHGSEIIEWASKEQDKLGFQGNYKKSFSIDGTTEGSVTFVTGNKFSINPDDLEEIKGILGDRFESLINVKHDVKLKSEVFTNEDLQNELMELIGDRFEDFFDTHVSAEVKDNYDSMVYTAVDTHRLMEKLRTFVKPHKPSLR